MAESVDIDLWQVKNAKGAGILEALLYLSDYIDNIAAWPHEQIKPIRLQSLRTLLFKASEKYPGDIRLQTALNKLESRFPFGPRDHFRLTR